MRVYKFGGASVKCADNVRNVAKIILSDDNPKLVIISAMGKTTNSFEWLLNAYCFNKEEIKTFLNEIVDYHNNILWDLFPERSNNVYNVINEIWFEIEEILNQEYDGNYDKAYDSLISYGEILSTTIVSNYLNNEKITNQFLDARKVIKTNSDFRYANVNWDITSKNIQSAINKNNTYITQGFIASDEYNNTTTLGREGSDYSGAIFSFCLNIMEYTIWKDVEGFYNADPNKFEDAKKLNTISYDEAIELSYFGASIIHPKTIKPLQNKGIKLSVKSFINPQLQGTVIQEDMKDDDKIPAYILLDNQILISFKTNDFTFIAEEHISHIFEELYKNQIKVNLIKNSARGLDICCKYDNIKIDKFIDSIKNEYSIKLDKNIELLTIRRYNDYLIDKFTYNKKQLVIQKDKNTARIVLTNI